MSAAVPDHDARVAAGPSAAVPVALPAGEVDPVGARRARRATGLLGAFDRAGVLEAADVHVATRVCALGGEDDERVALALALTVRAARAGSSCLDLDGLAEALARTPGAMGRADAPGRPDRDDDVPAGPPQEYEDHAGRGDEDGAEPAPALPWPEPGGWVAAVRRSPLVALHDDTGPGAPADAGAPPREDRPLHLVDGLLYLDRYRRDEEVVRAGLDARSGRAAAFTALDGTAAALDRLFPDAAAAAQRLAAAVFATSLLTVVAGGPGTGKTTAVARMLAALPTGTQGAGGPPRVALAAPTGRAAARLQEAVLAAAASPEFTAAERDRIRGLTASTIHRLLGPLPGSRSRFRRGPADRLPHDVVVVDETSMVSLTLMARLLSALRPQCRLVLLGDPGQLSSVEVGAVLGDIVARPLPPTSGAPDAPDAALDRLAGPALAGLDDTARERVQRGGIVTLSRNWRSGGRGVERLAAAVRAGDAGAALDVLQDGDPDVRLVEDSATGDGPTGPGVHAGDLHDDAVATGRAVHAAALSGDASAALRALDGHRVLCAHRTGPRGVATWGPRVEQWLAEALPGYGEGGRWYPGRPLLVTANDAELDLFNGDVGVVVAGATGTAHVAFPSGAGARLVPAARLGDLLTVHAMTVHRAQGSEFDAVTVVLPGADSPLLTRELLYTAVTRARERVRVVGTAEAVAAAVSRPVTRASGLRRRVRPS